MERRHRDERTVHRVGESLRRREPDAQTGEAAWSDADDHAGYVRRFKRLTFEKLLHIEGEVAGMAARFVEPGFLHDGAIPYEADGAASATGLDQQMSVQ